MPQQISNPNLRGGAVTRKKQHEVVLPDLDIFEKKEGVIYFNPDEWHAFPFGFNSVKGGHRHKKGEDNENGI